MSRSRLRLLRGLLEHIPWLLATLILAITLAVVPAGSARGG